MPSSLRVSLLILFTTLFSSAAPASGAALAAADQNDGYSGTVLDKVIAVWAPPPALKGDFEVRLLVSLDGQGRVLNCKAVKPSGMEALDSSACGAVRQVGVFGTPPYGMPLEVHLAFWTGVPKGKARPETLTSEEALRAEVRARTRAERAMGEEKAASVEERAKERAAAIALSAGQPLPEVEAAPVAPLPANKAKSAEAAKKKKVQAAGVAADSGPATEVIRASGEKARQPGTQARQAVMPAPALVAAPASKPAAAAGQTPEGTGLTEEEMRPDLGAATAKAAPPAAGAPVEAAKAQARMLKTAGPEKAQDKYGERYRKYFSNLTWDLRNAMFIPAETAPGTYYATVRLEVDQATGAIEKYRLLEGSGDKQLDRFVLQGIGRAGSVSPPPAGLGGTLDITFTLVRR